MTDFSRAKKGSDPLIMEVNYDPKNVELGNVFRLVDVSNKIVLEIGCGIGRVTTEIAKKAKQVYAVDIDNESIVTAKRKVSSLGLKNVKFDTVSADKINYPDNFFDLVL